jgi:hypothetical protein
MAYLHHERGPGARHTPETTISETMGNFSPLDDACRSDIHVPETVDSGSPLSLKVTTVGDEFAGTLRPWWS